MTDRRNDMFDTDLWMVEAVIKPFKLDAVTRALEGVHGFSGMTVTDARGFGAAKVRSDRATTEVGTSRAVRIASDMNDFDHKTRIEVAVAGKHVADAVAATIARTARTGNIGDGRVFLWPIARAIRIETGAEDAVAL